MQSVRNFFRVWLMGFWSSRSVFRMPKEPWVCLPSAAAAAASLQSCPTLCDPIDGSPPGSPVPGILQARTLEWVAISFSSAGKWNVKAKSLSRVWLLVTPWTAAHQAPPSMGFFRQEYWSGLPLPSPFLLLDGCKCFVDPYLCGEPDLPAQCSPWEQDAEWNKPDTKGHMLSDLTCMKVLE